MSSTSKILLAAIALCALVPLWGYWYSVRHADVNLQVHDYALRSPTPSYGDAHGVSVVLRDGSNRQLAVAHSVEPLGYILAKDPNSAIGDCRQFTFNQQAEYAACYAQYSKWSATWAPLVRTADVAVGACSLRAAPVKVERSNNDWPTWWVPLRHIGGLPRQYFNFVIAIDGRACAAHDP